jgi:hypothetical protein
MIKQIAVGNLPARATENDVKALFADYGRVTSVLFRGSGTSRVAYVDLSSNVEADAEAIIEFVLRVQPFLGHSPGDRMRIVAHGDEKLVLGTM